MVVYLHCQRCRGTASAPTEQQARDKINHSQGLSRGIACGDNYDQVIIIGERSYLELTGLQVLPDMDQPPKKTTVKTDEGKRAKVEEENLLPKTHQPDKPKSSLSSPSPSKTPKPKKEKSKSSSSSSSSSYHHRRSSSSFKVQE